MLGRALLVAPFFLVGCATSRPVPSIVGEEASISVPEVQVVETPTAPDAATGTFADFPPLADFTADSQGQAGAPPGANPMAPPPRPRERITFKGGYYGSEEDGLDDGYNFVVSWMRPVSNSLSSEVELGFLDASGTENGVDRDVWSVSLLANARFGAPVGQKLELYGGLGLGTFYYEAEAKALGLDVSADGFLFGGDAYFGGTIHVGQSAYIGLEGKYYVTDSASDLNGGLDAYVVLLTLGFER